jgi:UDP-N-acetylglucosamine acyltransferase
MSTHIHPTAVVDLRAQLGMDVCVGPYSLIGPDVRIGDRTRIGPHVVIDGVTLLGADNVLFGQSNLGAPPQDLSYDGEATCLEIGDRNTIREFVTINRGTVKGGGLTRIGSDCLFMACSHVAHDCVIEDRVILANNVLLAGHVMVERGAIINGAAAAHQFVTIGALAYVGGLTRIIQDVPPFMVHEGHPARVRKVNVVGLERVGYTTREIDDLRQAFRRVWRTDEPRHRVLEALAREEPSSLVRQLVEALRCTELGAKGRYRETLRSEFARAGQERVHGRVGSA